MTRPRLIALASVAALLVAAAALLWRRPAPAPSITVRPDGPGRSVTINRAPDDVFQRAFWRRPTAGDRIVHADRREWSEQGDVHRWRWFLEVHPSAALLHALRDPAGFGLVPAASTVASARPDSPDWFPSSAHPPGCEVLQHPAGGLTVYYRATDNVLFATDAGGGFAPPVVAVATR